MCHWILNFLLYTGLKLSESLTLISRSLILNTGALQLPQGYVLSPFLFTITNDCVSTDQSCNVTKYIYFLTLFKQKSLFFFSNEVH